MDDKSNVTVDPTSSGFVTRREFLRLAAMTSAGFALAVPAVAQTTTLNMLQWSHFVPEGDQYFDKWAADWGAKNKVQVKVEHINANDIPARLAAHVQAKAGPDIVQYLFNWAWLYPDATVDVSDVADKLGKDLGGWYKDIETYCKPGGTWKAIPFSFFGQSLTYREDWFKENNWSLPKTFDDLIMLAKDMKAKGHPFGQALGHSFTDPRVFWYPWLWSYGGKEVLEDGKTVAINSPETLEAVTKAVELFQHMVPGTLSWDDNSNNRAFLAGQIGATTNAASIYFTAKRERTQTRSGQEKQSRHCDARGYQSRRHAQWQSGDVLASIRADQRHHVLVEERFCRQRFPRRRDAARCLHRLSQHGAGLQCWTAAPI